MLKSIESEIARVRRSWSKTQIIRYLYVRLAPYFKRDIKFFFASYEEKLQECRMGFINRGFDICCSTLADFYVELFGSFGINAHKVQVTNKEIPLYALIAEGDDGWFYLDPLNDLFRNQYGLSTRHFGDYPSWRSSILRDTHPGLITYSKEDLGKIDESIDLYPYGTLDSFFGSLHHDFASRQKVISIIGLSEYDEKLSIERKLKLCSKLFINLGKVEGIMERGYLYEYLINNLFDRMERRGMSVSYHCEGNGLYVPRVHVNLADEEEMLYDELKEDGIYELRRVK